MWSIGINPKEITSGTCAPCLKPKDQHDQQGHRNQDTGEKKILTSDDEKRLMNYAKEIFEDSQGSLPRDEALQLARRSFDQSPEEFRKRVPVDVPNAPDERLAWVVHLAGVSCDDKK